MDALELLLRATPPRDPVSNVAAWLDRLSECPFEAPLDRAFWAGFMADRLGYAFVGGYQAALANLIATAAGTGPSPHLGSLVRRSLAATEAQGAHPRAIGTMLEAAGPGGALVLRGEKSVATLASVAEELLVVASRGPGPSGKNELSVVRVPANAPGVTIEDRPPMPFAPEIPHAKVKLVDVPVRPEDVLPGDGYTTYLKPFRTIEDIHVLAASLGYVTRCARAYGFDHVVAESAFTLALSLRQIAAMKASDPIAHVALAGLFHTARRLLDDHESEWNNTDADTRDRWARDLGLFIVAETARQKRTATAWKALAPAT